jgi:hypothetical protein
MRRIEVRGSLLGILDRHQIAAQYRRVSPAARN